MLGFFTGSNANANSAAAYAGVAQFTNTARLTQLNPNFANPVGFATTLQNTFLGNGVAAGSPANFFVVNPTVGLLGAGSQSVTLTTNDVDTWYDAMQLELRRRLSGRLIAPDELHVVQVAEQLLRFQPELARTAIDSAQ